MKSARDNRRLGAGGPVILQKGADALVIGLRLVELLHQVAVAGLEEFAAEPGFEVQRRIGVVAAGFRFQPALASSGGRRGGFAAARSAGPTIAVTTPERWMNSNWRLKMSVLSLSKPTMNPPMTSSPRCCKSAHRFHQIAPAILQLAAFLQPFHRRRFDADKHFGETGFHHQRAQLRVVRQVHRGFGEKSHFRPRAPPPGHHFAQQAPACAVCRL